MKADPLPVTPVCSLHTFASRGPRAVVTCAAGVYPARPAAAEGSCPPSGCYLQCSRTSVVCTSSLSPSPRSESQRRPSPRHTEGAPLRVLRQRSTIYVFCAANLQVLAFFFLHFILRIKCKKAAISDVTNKTIATVVSTTDNSHPFPTGKKHWSKIMCFRIEAFECWDFTFSSL